MKRTLAVLIAISILLLALSGCDEEISQAFVYDIDSNPENLDPQTSDSAGANIVISNTMEGLVSFDENGDLRLGAAESYTVSEDGLTYTFSLKRNRKWVDYKGASYGQVTAADFLFAFQRLFDTATGSVHASDFSCLEGAAAILVGEATIDDLGISISDLYTVAFKLAYSNAHFLELLATPAAMPCNRTFFLETKGTYGLDSTALLYNGPFYLGSWNLSRSQLVLYRSDHYSTDSGEPIAAEAVTLSILSEGEDGFERFTNGDTDAIIVTDEHIEQIDINQYTNKEKEDSVWVLVFNNSHPVLANKKIRQALAASLDHDSQEAYLASWMNPAGALVPHSVAGGVDVTYRALVGEDLAVAYDLETAKQLLNEGLTQLGLTEFPKVTVLYPDNEAYTNLLQQLQRQWQTNLSIFVNISPVSQGAVFGAVESQEYDIAMLPLRTQTNHPSYLLSMFTTSSTKNVSRYYSIAYDGLINEALNSQDEEASMMLFGEAEQVLINDVAIIPVAYQVTYYITNKAIDGIRFSEYGDTILFKYAQRLTP